MVVKMKANLEGLAEKANPVAELLAGMSNHQVRVTGVTFGAGEGKGIFSLERRVDTPFDDNRYFSAATLATSQHVEVLAKFEQMML